MADKPFAEAAARNTAPILEVLKQEYRECRNVLEIGSGTGQHAVAFGRALPHVDWLTSDLDENHAAIEAWINASGLVNVRKPISLDVRRYPAVPAEADAVFSSNTAHIMSTRAVADMFALAGRVLRPDGVFCLYGPFRVGGKFNTPSNAQFDISLRSRDPEMGIRDLEMLDEMAAGHALRRSALYAMPSNNFLAAWTRVPEAAS